MQLILASSSRYRKSLLDRLGVPFSQTAPDIDETPRTDESAADLALRLASQKAAHVAARIPQASPALVIGSDQTAVVGDAIVGKPGTAEKARAMLRAQSGTTMVFYTALAVVNTASGNEHTHVDVTRVRFRQLSEHDIARYVALENPVDCAGAIKSEGLGVTLLDGIDNDDPSALIGLPLIALCRILRQEALDPLA